MNDPHRVGNPDLAIAAALRQLARNGVQVVEQHRLGDWPFESIRLRTSSSLRKIENDVSAGKGMGTQALASALCEAVEHVYLDIRESPLWESALSIIPVGQLISEGSSGCSALLADQDARVTEAEIAALRVDSVYTGCSVHWPVFHGDPGYWLRPHALDTTDYSSIFKYSSSSGTASGLTADEATLHGLFELIEHDSLSHALLYWFIRGEGTLRLVNPTSLDGELAALYATACSEFGQVHLFDITTDLGVPSILALPNEPGAPASFLGLGCSDRPEYAAERALTELLQDGRLRRAEEKNLEKAYDPMFRRVMDWDALVDCIRLDARSLLATHPSVSIALSSIGSVGISSGVTEGLRNVCARLGEFGYDAFRVELTPATAEIHVVRVVAPDLERFSHVRAGFPGLPYGRGSRLWPALV